MRALKLTLTTVFAFGAPVAPVIGDSAVLERYYGVWFGRAAVVDERTISARRDIDVAIWKSETGFAITWRILSDDGTARRTIHFTAAGEPGIFEAVTTDPPLKVDRTYRAQIQSGRLTVYVSDVRDDERLASYEYSFSNGDLMLKYTLARNGKLQESTTSKLHRAKVVM